jgi:tRNA modification GTPase
MCAVLRLSGPRAQKIAVAAGIRVPEPWHVREQAWRLAEGSCPCRVLFAPEGRSFTGCDLVEIVLPGSRDLVEIALQALVDAGAERAGPGDFSRQALANGRITLPQAEAIQALAAAPTASAARQAVERLRSALAEDIARVREDLLRLRARIEAGLDFVEEDDVRAIEPEALRTRLDELAQSVARWIVAADSIGLEPTVALIGPANAGKSALFARLTGQPALVSPISGTTRDWLEGTWMVGDRALKLIDTAGWFKGQEVASCELHPEYRALRVANGQQETIDQAAIAAGQRMLPGAALILACSAPDAPLPREDARLRFHNLVVIGTKADLPGRDERAALSVSALTGSGLDELRELVEQRFSSTPVGEPRQQYLLRETSVILARLRQDPPPDVLLAEDLRRAADLLGELIGQTTPDAILNVIFSKFCIGK